MIPLALAAVFEGAANLNVGAMIGTGLAALGLAGWLVAPVAENVKEGLGIKRAGLHGEFHQTAGPYGYYTVDENSSTRPTNKHRKFEL